MLVVALVSKRPSLVLNPTSLQTSLHTVFSFALSTSLHLYILGISLFSTYSPLACSEFYPVLLLRIFVSFFCFMCSSVLPTCMTVKVPDDLELKLQTVESCHVGDGN